MLIEFSDHAQQRLAQRNLSENDVKIIMQYGYKFRNTGGIFIQMRAKDVPKGLSPNDSIHRLVNTTLILCSCGNCIITAYRNATAFHKDRCKEKYSLTKKMCSLCQERAA